MGRKAYRPARSVKLGEHQTILSTKQIKEKSVYIRSGEEYSAIQGMIFSHREEYMLKHIAVPDPSDDDLLYITCTSHKRLVLYLCKNPISFFPGPENRPYIK